MKLSTRLDDQGAAIVCVSRVNQLGFARVSRSKNPKSAIEKLKEAAESVRIPVPGARLPAVGFVNGLTLKELICGTIAGGVASAVTGPFGLVKSKLIAGKGGNTAKEVLENIARTQGLQSLRPGGWLMSICFASVQRGTQFVVFEAVKRREEQTLGEDPRILPLPRAIPISTVAGALSGLASLLVTYPASTISDRLLLQPNEYRSLFGSIRKVFEREGLGSLYNGAMPAVHKMVPMAAAEFYAYETLRKKYLDQGNKHMGVVASLVFGAAAGAFATALTYPLELARKEMSMSAVPGSGFSYSSSWQALHGIIAKHGVVGLYKGLDVELAQIVPSTAVSFVVYELAKRALIADEEK